LPVKQRDEMKRDSGSESGDILREHAKARCYDRPLSCLMIDTAAPLGAAESGNDMVARAERGAVNLRPPQVLCFSL
jgi:hypothetical protein